MTQQKKIELLKKMMHSKLNATKACEDDEGLCALLVQEAVMLDAVIRIFEDPKFAKEIHDIYYKKEEQQ